MNWLPLMLLGLWSLESLVVSRREIVSRVGIVRPCSKLEEFSLKRFSLSRNCFDGGIYIHLKLAFRIGDVRNPEKNHC